VLNNPLYHRSAVHRFNGSLPPRNPVDHGNGWTLHLNYFGRSNFR